MFSVVQDVFTSLRDRSAKDSLCHMVVDFCVRPQDQRFHGKTEPATRMWPWCLNFHCKVTRTRSVCNKAWINFAHMNIVLWVAWATFHQLPHNDTLPWQAWPRSTRQPGKCMRCCQGEVMMGFGLPLSKQQHRLLLHTIHWPSVVSAHHQASGKNLHLLNLARGCVCYAESR